MISILIPTYNYNIYPLVKILYQQCLELQIPFEICVVEDASSNVFADNDKITEFKNTNYKILESNVGRTKTRSLLAEKAHYNWLLFLDADITPVKENFIKTYLGVIADNTQVIFGGIEYTQRKPKNDYLLRWVYGNKRESKTVFERNKNPYYIISQNILIEKNTFLQINKHLDNRYGMDNIFSYRLQERDIRVKHINNPVYHHGLEKSCAFLEKSLLAVNTLIDQELQNNISENFTSLQKFYLQLKKIHLLGIAYKIISPFLNKMKHNLCSNKPRIFLLDLYKLHHYIKLKHGK
jgi:hypothetical protein